MSRPRTHLPSTRLPTIRWAARLRNHWTHRRSQVVRTMQIHCAHRPVLSHPATPLGPFLLSLDRHLLSPKRRPRLRPRRSPRNRRKTAIDRAGHSARLRRNCMSNWTTCFPATIWTSPSATWLSRPRLVAKRRCLPRKRTALWPVGRRRPSTDVHPVVFHDTSTIRSASLLKTDASF